MKIGKLKVYLVLEYTNMSCKILHCFYSKKLAVAAVEKLHYKQQSRWDAKFVENVKSYHVISKKIHDISLEFEFQDCGGNFMYLKAKVVK